jgi:2-iminobutanoate/2-iminopropanoate deaminase
MFKQSFFFFFTLKHSQAVQAGNVLYVSGSLGLDKKPLKPVEGGTAAKARQSLKNIQVILKHAGT